MSWFGLASSQEAAAPAQPTIDNYDMDLKVYVRSGTPLFKLSSINSPGVDKPDGVEAGTAPGTFTDIIMKKIYGEGYNTVTVAPVTTPAPSADAPVTTTAPVTTASTSPQSQASLSARVNDRISVLDEIINDLNHKINGYPKNVEGKDASEKGKLEAERKKLNQEKTRLLSPTRKGGRRTRHVRKGKHARKSHRNRKHTKRYFEFF